MEQLNTGGGAGLGVGKNDDFYSLHHYDIQRGLWDTQVVMPLGTWNNGSGGQEERLR